MLSTSLEMTGEFIATRKKKLKIASLLQNNVNI
jgi:hypothetical protein